MLGNLGWLGGGSSADSGPEKIAEQELDRWRDKQVLSALGLGVRDGRPWHEVEEVPHSHPCSLRRAHRSVTDRLTYPDPVL